MIRKKKDKFELPISWARKNDFTKFFESEKLLFFGLEAQCEFHATFECEQGQLAIFEAQRVAIEINGAVVAKLKKRKPFVLVPSQFQCASAMLKNQSTGTRNGINCITDHLRPQLGVLLS